MRIAEPLWNDEERYGDAREDVVLEVCPPVVISQPADARDEARREFDVALARRHLLEHPEAGFGSARADEPECRYRNIWRPFAH